MTLLARTALMLALSCSLYQVSAQPAFAAEKANGTVATQGEFDALRARICKELAEKVPRGLREVRIVIRQGRLELRGLANLSEFSELKQNAASAASFLSLLGGELAVEVVADFKSDRGFGQFELLTAQIGPVPLSASVVSDIVARATTDATRPNGFDIRAPFRLPYSAKRIRPQQALATIEY